MLFANFSRRERTLINKEIYKEFSIPKIIIRAIKKFFVKKEDNSPVFRVLYFARLLYYSKLKNKTKN